MEILKNLNIVSWLVGQLVSWLVGQLVLDESEQLFENSIFCTIKIAMRK